MAIQNTLSTLMRPHRPLTVVLIGTSLDEESDTVVRAGLAIAVPLLLLLTLQAEGLPEGELHLVAGRDDQAAGDGTDPPNPESLDPNRTLTGAEQERWLLSGLAASGSTWNVMAQQVFFAQRDFDTGPGQRFSMDAWDGYVGSRDRISNFILENDVPNPVVLTGDVHNNWACDLKADYDDQASETFGVEFVATSITSGGDGADTSPGQEAVVAANPHIKFFNGQRGYVLCTLTPEECRADYRVLPYVSQPGAPAYTRASFVTEAGVPGLQPAGTSPVRGVRVSEAAIESEVERVEAQEEAESR